MAGFNNSTESYKYNIERVINADELEDCPFWQMVQKGEALKGDFDWQGNEIMICTGCRSGTHMTWYLVRYLLQGSTSVIPDTVSESYYPAYDLLTSPQTGPHRVINCHLIPCQFTNDSLLKTGNRKFIYVIRNPHDTAVSMFNLWNEVTGVKCVPKEFPEYYDQFITGTAKTYPYVGGWFNHIKAWEEYATKNPDASIMFQIFEDLVRKPRESLIKIAKFLDVVVSDALLDELVEASKFSNMRKNKIGKAVDDHFAEDGNKVIFRKGAIGDWKNWLTVHNYELFEKVFSEQSADLVCKERLIFT